MKTKTIYKYFPRKYTKLKSFEDYQHNTIKTISQFFDLDNKIIVESGAGTGNLTFQLAKYAKKVYAFDISKSMISYAKKIQKKNSTGPNINPQRKAPIKKINKKQKPKTGGGV